MIIRVVMKSRSGVKQQTIMDRAKWEWELCTQKVKEKPKQQQQQLKGYISPINVFESSRENNLA